LVSSSETDREFRIQVDLPGHKKEDIDISVDDDILTVQTERREEHSEETENFHVKERRVGKAKRSIRLPRSADTDSVRAQYADGVLRICVEKKAEKGQSKSIKITDHSYPFTK
jgi:HSP20 family protein